VENTLQKKAPQVETRREQLMRLRIQIYNKSVEETNLFKLISVIIFDTCLEQVHTRYRILSDSYSLQEIEVYPINPKLRSRIVAVK
jgi:hypothetical protein